MTKSARDFCFVLSVAALVLAAGIGLREPWPADEPRFVLVAKQMIESGQYLIPHRGIEIYPDKPPLFMWLLAGAHALTGEWRVAFLLPSLLASLGTIALTFDLALKFWGRRAARIAALMLLFAFQFTYQAKRAQIDPFLVFAMTASAYALLSHALVKRSQTMHATGWFMAAIGTIGKGVGALSLLLLPVIALARRSNFTSKPGGAIVGGASRHDLLLGITAFIAAASIWLAPLLFAAATRDDPELHGYVREILFGQTARRYANPDHHFQPWWYFGEVMLTTWLPFVLAWPWALAFAWQQWRRRRDARVFVPLVWSALIVLFFSLSPGKRDMYILPVLPMLCVALAPGLVFASRRAGFRRLMLGFVFVLAVALLVCGLWAALGAPAFELRREAARELAGPDDAVWWMLATVGAIGLGAALWLRARRALNACFVLLAALWIGIGFVAYPALDAHSSGRAVMQRARDAAGDATIGFVGWREQNLLQAIGPVEEFGFKRAPARQFDAALAWLRNEPTQRVLFADAAALPVCVDRASAIQLGTGNRRGWVLLREAGLADCAISP